MYGKRGMFIGISLEAVPNEQYDSIGLDNRRYALIWTNDTLTDLPMVYTSFGLSALNQ